MLAKTWNKVASIHGMLKPLMMVALNLMKLCKEQRTSYRELLESVHH